MSAQDSGKWTVIDTPKISSPSPQVLDGGWTVVDTPSITPSTDMHFWESAGKAFPQSFQGMKLSFDRGLMAWMKFNEIPEVAAIRDRLPPTVSVSGLAALIGKALDIDQETVGARIEQRSQKLFEETRDHPTPEASFESWDKKNFLNTFSNWAGYQFGAVPGQVLPGFAGSILGGAVAGKAGLAAGGFVPSFLQNGGELYGTLLEKGLTEQEAAKYAMLGGVLMGSLDTAAFGYFGKKVLDRVVMKPVKEAMVKKLVQKALLARVAKGVGKLGLESLGEGGNEGAQEIIASAIEHWQTAGPEDEFFSRENLVRWGDSFLAGVFMGAEMGAAGHLVPQAKQRYKSFEDLRQEDAKRQTATREAEAAATLAGEPLPDTVAEHEQEQRQAQTLAEEQQSEEALAMVGPRGRYAELLRAPENADLPATNFEEFGYDSWLGGQIDAGAVTPEDAIARLRQRREAPGDTVRVATAFTTTAFPTRAEAEAYAARYEDASIFAESDQIQPETAAIIDRIAQPGMELDAIREQLESETDLSEAQARAAVELWSIQKQAAENQTAKVQSPEDLVSPPEPALPPESVYTGPESELKSPAEMAPEKPAQQPEVTSVSKHPVPAQQISSIKPLPRLLHARIAASRVLLEFDASAQVTSDQVASAFPEYQVSVTKPQNPALGNPALQRFWVDFWRPTGEIFTPDKSILDRFGGEQPHLGTQKPSKRLRLQSQVGPEPTTTELPSIHDVIQERDTEYHATDITSAEKILESGNIQPFRILEGGKQVHTSRAAVLREKAAALGLSAKQTIERLKARIAAQAEENARRAASDPHWGERGTVEFDAALYRDLVDYGVTKLREKAYTFAAWSAEMVVNFGDSVKPILKDLWAAAKAREKDLDLPPAHSNTEAAIRALEQAGGPQDPSMIRTLRADLDSFGWGSKWWLSVEQWARRNMHDIWLGAYVKRVKEYAAYADSIREKAVEVRMLWDKLSGKQQRAVAEMAYEMTLWSDAHPQATQEELDAQRIASAQKHGVSPNGMTVYDAFRRELKVFHEEHRTVAIEKIKRDVTLSAEQKVEAIKQIEEAHAKQILREYFPICRFGDQILLVFATKDMEFEGKKVKKDDLVYSEHMSKLAMKMHPQGFAAKDMLRKYPGKLRAEKSKIHEGGESFLGYPASFLSAVIDKFTKEGKPLTEEQRRVLEQMIIDASPAQAFIQHYKMRKGIGGFSLDLGRAFSTYFSHGANHMARLKFRDQLEADYAAFGKTIPAAGEQIGDRRTRITIADAIKNHLEDLMQPKSYASKLRAGMFAWYFWYAPKQAIVNNTQLAVYAAPYFIGQLSNDGVRAPTADLRVARTMGKAIIDATRMFDGHMYAAIGSAVGGLVGYSVLGPIGGAVGANLGGAVGMRAKKKGVFDLSHTSLSERDARALQRAMSRGELDQGYGTMISGSQSSSGLGSNASRLYRVMSETGSMYFRASEQFNRIVTVLTASRLAEQQGLSEEASHDAVSDAIEATMFPYERWAQPRVFRSRAGAPLFIFKMFQQKALFAHWNNPGRMRSLLMLGLLGGIMAIPGGDDLRKLIEGLGTWYNRKYGDGKDPIVDVRTSFAEFLRNLDQDPDIWFNGIGGGSFGTSMLQKLGANLGIPEVHLSASISMGRVFPFIDSITNALKGGSSTSGVVKGLALDALGVAGTVGNGALQYAFDDSGRSEAFWRMTPQFSRSFMLAAEAQRTGEIKGSDGRTLIKFNTSNPEQRHEIMAMAVGIMPQRLVKARTQDFLQAELEKHHAAFRQDLTQNFAKAMAARDNPAEYARLLKIANEQLSNYNKSMVAAKLYTMVISGDAVRSAARQEIRGTVLHDMGLPEKKTYIDLKKRLDEVYGVPRP